jgi:hypothetical protein
MPHPSQKRHCRSSTHAAFAVTNENLDSVASIVIPATTVEARIATEHMRDEPNVKKETSDDFGASFIMDAFDAVCKHVQLRRHWISSHIYADAINTHYGFTSPQTKIDAAKLNRVIMSTSSDGGRMGHFIKQTNQIAKDSIPRLRK